MGVQRMGHNVHGAVKTVYEHALRDLVHKATTVAKDRLARTITHNDIVIAAKHVDELKGLTPYTETMKGMHWGKEKKKSPLKRTDKTLTELMNDAPAPAPAAAAPAAPAPAVASPSSSTASTTAAGKKKK